MKAVKIVAGLCLAYGLVVVAFESMLGWFQPKSEATIVITTTDDRGVAKTRVVSRIDSGGQLYVAANHWPRSWYMQVLAHPDVQIDVNGERRTYRAVPVTGPEFERVNADHPLGPMIRILTGFPPRRIVRLDPA